MDDVTHMKDIKNEHGYPIYMMFEVIDVYRKSYKDIKEENQCITGKLLKV